MHILKPKIKIVICLFLLFSASSLHSFAQQQGSLIQATSSQNSAEQSTKPYLIVICGDGFRFDYATKYRANNLLSLSKNGIRAEKMIPSYPSVTHSNHFTMLTGLYPGHTGIAGNSFYDPSRKSFFKFGDGSWFNGEPIWATAEKQQMLTANFRWVDANVKLGQDQISYIFRKQKNQSVGGDEGAAFVSELLNLPEAKRPHLILMYFSDTDHDGHIFGPESKEVAEAVARIDHAVGQINGAAEKSGLKVNFMFVSDHGMAKIDQAHPIRLPAIDTTKFIINNQNSLVNIYAKDTSASVPLYQRLKASNSTDYDVYLNRDIPSDFHYGGEDDRYKRAGDIVMIARFPKTFNQKPGAGAHGFDPFNVGEMGASFFAWGPAFKTGITIAKFQNIELYDLMASILELKAKPNDGKGILSKLVLK